MSSRWENPQRLKQLIDDLDDLTLALQVGAVELPARVGLRLHALAVNVAHVTLDDVYDATEPGE